MRGPDEQGGGAGGSSADGGGSPRGGGPDGGSGEGAAEGGAEGSAAQPPRIPPPRSPADDSEGAAGPCGRSAPTEDRQAPPRPEPAAPAREPVQLAQQPEQFDHRVLKSLLGAWALSACSAEETAAVEGHLSECGACADEALRLRDAVALLHPEDSLDLDPALRSQVLHGCMARRAPRVPVPEWAAPYDAEASRLDALLRDMADEEWLAPVRLRWFDGRHREKRERDTTVAGVIAHLLAVDGLVASALGMPDPLDVAAASGKDRTGDGPGGTGARDGVSQPVDPEERTERFWRADCDVLRTPAARRHWREQGHALLRTASFASDRTAGVPVPYGEFTLPVRDALLERAFECWMHAEDIATAIHYPYTAPQSTHLHHMVDLAARMLPETIARRRRAGLAGPPRRLSTAGTPGRALHLEVEGDGGGDWYIPLDSPAAAVRPGDAVAHVALDDYEFCQLAAGHVAPAEAMAGRDGDREAIEDVLFATASLSRM
ncbi:Putative zinc-finger [Streptomyces sp. WMMB 714]|uniref:zf-HC2 domain-containing protein n=1 Tax=Streptomyces sp. WMMB 714 TaxID=1286822 RepID=UPI000823ADFC|nr:zf-HC2 domain-containing protein [Streptomyces sp. WMMB 714]SCK40548.1 Putative zinc-finger [Streptomyces sp. WMMB 714]